MALLPFVNQLERFCGVACGMDFPPAYVWVRAGSVETQEPLFYVGSDVGTGSFTNIQPASPKERERELGKGRRERDGDMLFVSRFGLAVRR